MNGGTAVNNRPVERLVKAAQSGDRGAFDELVRLYQHRAMQLAVGILAGADEAAEAVQIGFVKAYLNIDKLREPRRFEAWLLKIIANAAISQARAARCRESNVRIAHHQDAGSVSPAETQSAEELKEAVRRAMRRLSKKEAKAISLFGLEGLSHKQVAEIMGCSVEAARWRVFNARKKLKVLLKEYLQ
ncbi:MAG: RNA polymerase sigma factor [Planctomycetota bacterium]